MDTNTYTQLYSIGTCDLIISPSMAHNIKISNFIDFDDYKETFESNLNKGELQSVSEAIPKCDDSPSFWLLYLILLFTCDLRW